MVVVRRGVAALEIRIVDVPHIVADIVREQVEWVLECPDEVQETRRERL